jgi:predicted tellurium resistance membrane protein TerC
MIDLFLQTETWIALLTLTFLEIVLGVDNIIFISILTNKLPEDKQQKVRSIGLLMAMLFRILLLLGISYLVKFTEPLYTINSFDIIGITFPHYDITGRNLILLFGGLFLLIKSTTEIFHKMEVEPDVNETKNKVTSIAFIFIQIILLDLIFSFDSILTAVGLVEDVIIMILAVIISILVMMVFAGKISSFINKHPSMQILALSFLILIGFMLILESLEYEIPKGYIYFAIFFSLIVELVNMRLRNKKKETK